ncbi:MAG: hypothetical protein GY856_07095 [bacterium]|nr:hypothetical protein [bacterium]
MTPDHHQDEAGGMRTPIPVKKLTNAWAHRFFDPRAAPEKTRRPWLGEVLVLVLVTAGLTAGAVTAFPIWDDGWLRLIEVEHGNQQIRDAMADRPFIAWIWAELSRHGLLWSSGVVIHFLAWLGLGLVTLAIWKRLFPDQKFLALAAACLAVAPITAQTQLILVNPVWGGLIGPVLIYGALLLIWPAADSGRFKLLYGVAAGVLVFLSILISEYALSAVAAAMLLLLFNARGVGPQRRRRYLVALGLLATTAFVGYVAFRAGIDSSLRTDTNPTYLLHDLAGKTRTVPFNLFSSFWSCGIGNLLERIGTIQIRDFTDRVAALAGLTVGLLSLWATCRSRQESSASDTARRRRILIGLAAALVAALVPVLLMGRVPEAGTASRYWLPLVPVSSCLSVLVLVTLLGSGRRWAIPALCGFLAGYWGAHDAVLYRADRTQIRVWAEQIRPHLTRTGNNVVVLHAALIPLRPRLYRLADYELTARFAESLPPEYRGKLWVLKRIGDREAMLRDVGEYPHLGSDPYIEVDLRQYGPKGAIARAIWVMLRADGTLAIRSLDSRSQPPSAYRPAIPSSSTSKVRAAPGELEPEALARHDAAEGQGPESDDREEQERGGGRSVLRMSYHLREVPGWSVLSNPTMEDAR